VKTIKLIALWVTLISFTLVQSSALALTGGQKKSINGFFKEVPINQGPMDIKLFSKKISPYLPKDVMIEWQKFVKNNPDFKFPQVTVRTVKANLTPDQQEVVEIFFQADDTAVTLEIIGSNDQFGTLKWTYKGQKKSLNLTSEILNHPMEWLIQNIDKIYVNDTATYKNDKTINNPDLLVSEAQDIRNKIGSPRIQNPGNTFNFITHFAFFNLLINQVLAGEPGPEMAISDIKKNICGSSDEVEGLPQGDDGYKELKCNANKQKTVFCNNDGVEIKYHYCDCSLNSYEPIYVLGTSGGYAIECKLKKTETKKSASKDRSSSKSSKSQNESWFKPWMGVTLGAAVGLAIWYWSSKKALEKKYEMITPVRPPAPVPPPNTPVPYPTPLPGGGTGTIRPVPIGTGTR